MVPNIKAQYKFLASRMKSTVALSAVTGEGSENLAAALEDALTSNMEEVDIILPYTAEHAPLLDSIHTLGFLDSVIYKEDGIYISGKIPLFLKRKIDLIGLEEEVSNGPEGPMDKEFDWSFLDSLEGGLMSEDEGASEDMWDSSKLLEVDDY